MQILTLKATTQGTFQVFFVSDCMIFPILLQYFVEGVGWGGMRPCKEKISALSPNSSWPHSTYPFMKPEERTMKSLQS